MNTVKPAPAPAPPDGNNPKARVITPLVIATRVFNTLVPLFLFLFAWAHAAAFIQTLRISILIILAKAVLEIEFYVHKSTAPFVRTSAYAWLIALCGTIAPLMFRPTEAASDFPGAIAIQVIGLAMLVHVIRTLDKRAETAVARHGVGMDGLYHVVRHPIYLALMLGEYGYVLNHTSFYNVCVLAFVTFFQVLRIKEEERLLLDDEEFQGYVKQTRWRLIPGVF